MSKSGEWVNWAGDQRCRPARTLAPRSREELAEAVGAAAAAGEKVSVAGSAHSFTETAMTDATMLRLGALRGVLDADRESGLVRVGAGTVLADLNGELDALGLALENLGDIDAQTIAGAISTGTHGTGAGLANISARVEGLELVLADGSVRELTPRPTPELLRAARIGIGALGAISAVTIRCFPAFTLRRVDSQHQLADVLDRFDELATTNDHFELFTFPYSDRALVLERNRTDEAPKPKSRVVTFLNDTLLENWVLEALAATGKAIPRTIPPLARFAGWVASGSTNQDASHRIFVNRRNVRFTEMEYAVPRENGPEAVRRVVEWVRANRLSGLLPDRGAGGGGRRRRPQRRPRPRHRLRRRPPVPGDGVAPLLRGGRGDHERLRRPPPLGQAPLPDRRDPGASLPELGRLPSSPRRARPRPHLHQRVRRARPRP